MRRAVDAKIENKDPNTMDIFDNMTDKEREIVANKNTYADSIGATELHRQNLIKQALEQHRQAEQQAKDKAEQEQAERQAQLAKKQAEKLAKDEQERKEKEQAEQRKNAMIAKFESLPKAKQEKILDEVQENVGGVFARSFKEARARGTAHKDVMFMSWFFKILGL